MIVLAVIFTALFLMAAVILFRKAFWILLQSDKPITWVELMFRSFCISALAVGLIGSIFVLYTIWERWLL